LFSLLLWLSVGELTRRRLISLGAVLGLGLLAKAYFLAAIPPVAVLLLWKCRRPRALLVPLVTLAIAGWWYVRNLVVTGTLSGMQESAMQPTAALGAQLVAQLNQATRVPLLATPDFILFSRLWLGACSTLPVRSWMDPLFYLLIALSMRGLAFRISTSAIRILGG